MPEKTLGEYVEQVRGVAYSPNDLSNSNEGFPLLRATNIKGGALSFENLVFVNKKAVKQEQMLKIGDVLICASSGSRDLVGKAGVFRGNEAATFGAFCKVIRIRDSQDIEKEYLRWFFFSRKYRNLISQASLGSNIHNIKSKDISNIFLNIPSLDTQKEAVKSFDLISKAILVKKKEQESLISLIKSRFIEMFFNSQKFVEEPLGKNVIQMNIGPFGSDLKKDAFVSKDNSFCMVYEQKHAIDKTFSDNNRFINHQTYEKLKRFAVGPSDIIVTCRGTIGKIYVLPKEASIGIIHPSLMMIRLNRDIYEPTFFSFLLQKELYAFQANGATIAMGIKASELSKRKMIVPPMNRQKDFVDYYQLLDKSGFVNYSKYFL